MLLQFSVENFRSYKKRAVLSLEASNDTAHSDNLIEDKGSRILPTAVIFGANAAGKSNIFFALTAAILMVRNSNVMQQGQPIDGIIPFLFDEESRSQPSSFEFVFTIHHVKYVYGFSATKERVYTEYLYKYLSSRPTTLFERGLRTGEENDYYIHRSLRKELTEVIKRNTQNKLFLATATAWNCEETAIPFSWFNQIDTYTSNYEQLLTQAGPLFAKDEQDEKHELKKFVCQLLHEADINIDDYDFHSKEIRKEEIIQHIPAPISPVLSPLIGDKLQSWTVTMNHRIRKSGENTTYALDRDLESKGTLGLLGLSPLLRAAFNSGHILCIDEFDTSLHPMLVLFLVGLFHNPDINKGHSQLIISTHTSELLSTKIMRRDQIYFVEKDKNTGESELYSLDEFPDRGQENLRKAYLLGRYGAIPDIGDGELLW